MKDSTDLHIQGLEMKGGLNGVDYPQKFVKAPKSAFPSKPPKAESAKVNDPAMKMSCGE